jgi:hypothetical protein
MRRPLKPHWLQRSFERPFGIVALLSKNHALVGNRFRQLHGIERSTTVNHTSYPAIKVFSPERPKAPSFAKGDHWQLTKSTAGATGVPSCCRRRQRDVPAWRSRRFDFATLFRYQNAMDTDKNLQAVWGMLKIEIAEPGAIFEERE